MKFLNKLDIDLVHVESVDDLLNLVCGDISGTIPHFLHYI